MKEANGFYMYVSTRACYDPAKTIFVFAPGEMAADLSLAEQFARKSGWQALSEYDGAVLILPLAPEGWNAQSHSLPGSIYDRVRGQVGSRNGRSLFGREGKLWCWETMLYLVGYEDGAVFAGNCAMAEPNRFAAAALIGGAPDGYSAGAFPSSHWLVRHVSSDYAKRNDQIPSSLWLIGAPETASRQALEYACSLHFPDGCPADRVKGLPILFSVHGRGEPVWLFAEKNGWDVLADETQAFVLVCPDSPGNISQLERDGQVFGAMIDRLCADYGLDRTRVYLTGFSNGGAITREVGTAFPELFAAIAPSNAPVDAPGLVADSPVSPGLLRSGYELPYWVCVGDNDPAAGTDVDEQLEVMLEVNGCQARAGSGFTTRFAPDEIRTGENYYTSARGYAQGERFRTLVYCGRDGLPRVGYTVMKNMPHGAICEQSRAAWEFLRHFRRPAGSRQIEYLPD